MHQAQLSKYQNNWNEPLPAVMLKSEILSENHNYCSTCAPVYASDLEPIRTAFQLVIICLDFNNAAACANYSKLYSHIGLIQWLPIIIGVAG